ncbi:hypothetical protein PENSPDRAFT_619649 [Peniophora sp. CONT]|nr:hypothetical protein PENSPDRAFT_619649 [Peniophora sp. CONT]
MVTPFSSPVLSVAVDAVRDLEGKDALGGLWNLFTKCKESLQDGRRLENISWRLWHRELAAGAHHHTDISGCVHSDRNAASTAAPLSPISDYGRGSSQDFEQRLRSPSPALSVQSAISGVSSRPASVRSNSSSSIGRIIVDMLPENKIDTTPPSRRPSVTGPPEPVSFRADSSSLPTPDVETVAPFPTVVLPPISTNLGTTAPTAFPRVVIVNPTPHPTPPATPAPHSSALVAPQPLHTHLLPPPRLLSVSQSRSTATAQVTESQEAVKQPIAPVSAPQPMPALSAPVPAPAKSSAAEGKAVDRRFFLEQSPDNQSASSQASSSPARSGPSGRAPSAEAARSPSIASARSPSSEAGSTRGADPSSVNSNQTHASATSRRSGQHRSHQPRHNMTRARFSQRMHPLVQRKAAGTEAQHKAGSKGMFDVGSLDSDVSRATSSQRRPSESTGKASPSPAASSALAPASSGKARAAAEVRPVEPRKPAAPARPPLMRAQTGPAHMSSRVTTAPPPLAKVPSVNATKSALKQPSTVKQPAVEPPRRKVVVASSDDYETTEGSESESDGDGDGSTSDWEDDEDEQPKNKADEARLRAAALEAQRQRELFDKLPKRSYSNLNRTQSGLLTQLLNPDPAVLPSGRPQQSSSSANLQRGFVPAPMLSTSQSMAAIPQLSNITAQAPQARVDGQYRPRGRPADQELEDDSTDEEGDDDDGLSRSLAQQKLAELTDPNRRRRRSDQDQEPPRRTSPERSTLTSVATAPIPLNHPWNLPAPAPPMTPRTTRRQMLSTELSESLRRNLLWERQVSKTNLLRGGLKPLTQTRPEPQPEPETEEQRRERERKERSKAAIARHRSWADDYHYSGW